MAGKAGQGVGGGLEGDPQLGEPAGALALDGADGASEQSGDLGFGQVLDVAEDDSPALTGGEPGEGAAELVPLVEGDVGIATR